MSKAILIRKAEPEDSLKLSVFLSHVFIQTYDTEGVTQESSIFIKREFSSENIERKIKANPDSFLIAEKDENLRGVAEIDFNTKCPANNIPAAELCKLYVMEKFTGTGIGYSLINESESIVSSKNINHIWLSVYELNSRAILFYERQGYKYIGDILFQMEFNSYINKVLYKEINKK